MLWCDTHVHSYRSFVGAENMSFAGIADMAKRQGIDVVAVTDHLMSEQDIENLKTTAVLLKESNQTNDVGVEMLFGVEVCETDSYGNTLLTPSLIDELQFELIIGGVHETHLDKGASLIDIAQKQHKHHMMMLENPHIEILVHPWWFDRNEFLSKGFEWPQDMSFIPKELTVCLAHASAATETYIEISSMSGLCNKDSSLTYRNDLYDYYRLLNDEGALFAIGTDAHELSEMKTYDLAKELVYRIGIDESRLYRPCS